MEDTVPPVVGPSIENGQADPEEWQFDKRGKAYVPRRDGRPGIISRQGDEETVADARERDSSAVGGERRPRRKAKTPKLPPKPRKADIKELEEPLAAALKAPGAIAMSFGDEWAFEHFNAAGPYLARQMVVAAQYNPWLREKLEAAASGEEATMRIMGVMMIGGALVMYLVPPTIYFLNLKVPDKAREMLNVPARREPANVPSPPADQAGQAGQQPAWAA